MNDSQDQNDDQNEDQYAAEYDKLIDLYYEAEDVKTRLSALEDAIRLADGAGDVHSAFGVRMELIQVATFAAQKDKALVAFTWCLSQFDKHPDDFDPHSLLWSYKWILGNLPSFPDVTLEKITQLEDDFRQRLLDGGYNLRPILFLQWTIAMEGGRFELAKQYFAEWEQTTRDEMADCEACEVNKISDLFGRLGQPEEAIKRAEKLVDGSMGCAEIPHVTYGHLVRQYWKLNRVDEIKSLQPEWYKIIKDNPEFVCPVSEHLLLVAATGQISTGLAMFERHAPWAAESVNQHNRFEFFQSASVLFDRLAADGKNEIKVQIPKEFAVAREDHAYESAQLATWFRKQAESIADRFDARNGNKYYREILAETDSLVAGI